MASKEDILKALKNKSTIKSALRMLDAETLQQVEEKFLEATTDVYEEIVAKEEAEKARLEKIEALKEEMKRAGITAMDILGNPSAMKSKGIKREPKYQFEDQDGNLKKWAGVGRMPRVLADALEKGASLEDFKISK